MRLQHLLLLVLLAFGVTACGERISSHGHSVDEFELNSVEIGVTTRNDILLSWGKPSFDGAFDSGKIYYVSQNMRQPAGGRKVTTKREIFVLTFDDNDILQMLELRDQDTGLTIATLDAITPTPGDSFGVIEQIFSNVRRRNANE